MNRVVAAALATACTLPANAALAGSGPSQWKLGIDLRTKVAASHFNGTVTHRYAGLRTRIGEKVTLRVDRRTDCTRQTGAETVAIRCGVLGTLIAARPGIQVIATGQFETGHFGAIGFSARTVLIREK